MRHRSLHATRAALLICALQIPLSASAAMDAAPIPLTNQLPLARVYGFPGQRAAPLLSYGETRTDFHLAWASHFFDEAAPNERLTLDGESWDLRLNYRQGAAWGEWSVTLPFITHSGGSLDGLIDGWHDLTGLPDGGRPNAPRDRLLYRYARNGVEQFRVQHATQGVGDLAFEAAWPIVSQAMSSTAPGHVQSFHLRLELPTGDAGHLHGSGSTDLAGWLSDSRPLMHHARARLHAQAGLLFATEGDLLPGQQNSLALFGGVTMNTRTPWGFDALLQLDAHGSMYQDTAFKPLASTATLLTLGACIPISGMRLDLALSEDLVSQTGPDVVFLFSLRTAGKP